MVTCVTSLAVNPIEKIHKVICISAIQKEYHRYIHYIVLRLDRNVIFSI